MLAWFGTTTSIIGSFLVAMAFFKIGYVCFTLGSLTWLYIAYIRRDRALGVLNATFFVANLVGLYNFFLRG